MLSLKIIATVLLGLSLIFSPFKNVVCYKNEEVFRDGDNACLINCIFSILWRAFVIVVIWVV